MCNQMSSFHVKLQWFDGLFIIVRTGCPNKKLKLKIVFDSYVMTQFCLKKLNDSWKAYKSACNLALQTRQTFHCKLDRFFTANQTDLSLQTRQTFHCKLDKPFTANQTDLSLQTRQTFHGKLDGPFTANQTDLSLQIRQTFHCKLDKPFTANQTNLF